MFLGLNNIYIKLCRMFKGVLIVFLSSLYVFLISCNNKKAGKEYVDYEKLILAKQPNILWLVTEDMGAYIAPFGDSTVHTPNLNRLAKEGIVYPHLYSTSGVCAPSRAAIATGMYPSGIGANHMRVNSYTDVTGLPAYEAVPPTQVRMISELLREQGWEKKCSFNSRR